MTKAEPTTGMVLVLARRAIEAYRKPLMVDSNIFRSYGNFGRGERASEEVTRCDNALAVIDERLKKDFMERLARLAIEAEQYISKNPRANHANVRKYLRERNKTASRSIIYDAVELAFIRWEQSNKTGGLPLFSQESEK